MNIGMYINFIYKPIHGTIGSFLLRKSCNLYNRRSRWEDQFLHLLFTNYDSKIASTFASLFAATYTFSWAEYFPETPLQYPPSFDGRVVAYPSSKEILDYFAWRQADSGFRATLPLVELTNSISSH